jgi:hypothetical protein
MAFRKRQNEMVAVKDFQGGGLYKERPGSLARDKFRHFIA